MARRPTNRFTPEKKARFLEELRAHGTVWQAAKLAGISRVTAYKTRERDEEFSEAWDEAVDSSVDEIERSLYDRAVNGLEEPVYQGGRLVGTKRVYDTTAAIFLLKGARPEKYRERFEHSGLVDLRAQVTEFKLPDNGRSSGGG